LQRAGRFGFCLSSLPRYFTGNLAIGRKFAFTFGTGLNDEAFAFRQNFDKAMSGPNAVVRFVPTRAG
jgi:hypothetical protein